MQQQLSITPIFTIQLHIHCSHLFTFSNTFFIEVLKRYARGIKITIIEHQHPLHSISELPFAIVNGTEIVGRAKMGHLVRTVAIGRPLPELFLRPIVVLCQELSAVGRIVSQEPNNPYFLLLSPLKKYQVYKWNNQFRKTLFQQTQYFNPYTQQLQKQHFLYKLDCLATYLSQVNKTPIVILCVYAMMKSLKCDNRMLYETVSKNEIFKTCQEEGLKMVTQGVERIEIEPRFFGTVPMEGQELKNKGEEKKAVPTIFSSKKIEFLTRMALPVIGLAIFWRIHRSQSVPVMTPI